MRHNDAAARRARIITTNCLVNAARVSIIISMVLEAEPSKLLVHVYIFFWV